MNDNHFKPAWTEERLAMLDDLWKQGLSSRACGRVLGCSRNAVIGIVHRKPDRYVKRGQAIAKLGVIRKRPAKSPKLKRVRVRKAAVTLAGATDRELHDPFPEFPILWPIEKKPYVGILELDDKICRYPLWDGTITQQYCGKETKGDPPYCKEHRKMCFTPYQR